ncbi:MAG: hypothetical protein HY708_06750 [Ignavibacteriae bacterium]|nr:hypothetical protein [Ignavibacteriota bacterium]
MRRIIIVVCCMIISTPLFAGNGSSVYSVFGIGDIRYFPNSRSAGMGYTGIGLPASNYINNINPASWARTVRVRLEANFLYEGMNSTDASTSLYRANGLFNGASLAIPIVPSSGIVFSGGFSPLSYVNYQSSSSGSQQGIDYTITGKGTGGLNKAHVGLSVAPSQELAFGASLNYNFGTLEETRSIVPSSTSLGWGQITHNLKMNGITVTVGGMFTGFGSISESLTPLSFGFAITSRGVLTTEKRSTYLFLSEADSSDIAQGKFSMPISFGFGFAYQAGERYLVAADYFAQPWSKADLDGAKLNGVRNNFRIGLGGERLPNKDFGARWLDRFAYRLGFYFNSSYYQVNGEPINEWGITGGFAVPLTGDTRLNMAIEYASRGTKKSNLVKDNIIRVAMSLNISELWFVRYEEE